MLTWDLIENKYTEVLKWLQGFWLLFSHHALPVSQLDFTCESWII